MTTSDATVVAGSEADSASSAVLIPSALVAPHVIRASCPTRTNPADVIGAQPRPRLPAATDQPRPLPSRIPVSRPVSTGSGSTASPSRPRTASLPPFPSRR